MFKEGEVEVSLGDGEGEHRVLTQLGKGNIFAEMSLLTGAERESRGGRIKKTIEESSRSILEKIKAFFGLA